jgi:hypothetical protein
MNFVTIGEPHFSNSLHADGPPNMRLCTRITHGARIMNGHGGICFFETCAMSHRCLSEYYAVVDETGTLYVRMGAADDEMGQNTLSRGSSEQVATIESLDDETDD